MVWLNGCPVSNIAPLKGLPLKSLTLHLTRVVDLSPLSGSSLERLHIGETPVEDLTPLLGLHLTRLVFTPDRIKKGLEVVKAMPLGRSAPSLPKRAMISSRQPRSGQPALRVPEGQSGNLVQ